MKDAAPSRIMVNRFEDLIAWQRGEDFKEEVIKLLEGSESAQRNFRFRDQLLEAARGVSPNIAEGFLRNSPGDFDRFLGIGLGSLAEAEIHLRDGIRLGYFSASSCAPAFGFAKRCMVATVRLRKSLEPFLGSNRRRPRTQNPRTSDRRNRPPDPAAT